MLLGFDGIRMIREVDFSSADRTSAVIMNGCSSKNPNLGEEFADVGEGDGIIQVGNNQLSSCNRIQVRLWSGKLDLKKPPINACSIEVPHGFEGTVPKLKDDVSRPQCLPRQVVMNNHCDKASKPSKKSDEEGKGDPRVQVGQNQLAIGIIDALIVVFVL